jgi:single-strand DNA-binding protein
MLAGNLTRDPQVKFLANERAVASFGIAINRRTITKDGQKDDTTFVDCEAWGRDAEILGQYFVKGTPIFIEGRLKLDSWEDKETGKKQMKLCVVAERIQFVAPKVYTPPRDPPSPEPQDEPPRRAPARSAPASTSDEPPF